MRRILLPLPLLLLAAAASTAQAASTTLVISEFRTTGSVGGNDEFIEIHNLTNAPIDVSGYKINGSNNSGSTSTRATIPSGTTIPAHGFFLLTNATPGTGYSGAVPGDQTYTTGITDTGGIALLDPSSKIIDAVGMSAGSAYKEGAVLASLTSGQDASYRRKGGNCSPTQDTDDNASDFEKITPSTPQNLSSCCSNSQCSSPPAGQCYGATGTCDTSAGTCSYAFQPGKSCDDGNSCTSADVCLASGACQGTTISCNNPPAPVCVNATTQRTYTTPGTCSSGACSYTFVDSTCSCNAATGVCQDPCAGVTCNTPPNSQCYQAAGACNNGSCSYTKKATGTSCTDGNACTTSDQCDAAGACVGAPKVCTPPPTECVGNASRSYSGGTCNTSTGACSFSQSDTPCAFGCDGATGSCKANPCSGVTCNTPPGACYQAIGVCDSGTGLCSYSPKPSGTSCDDGKPCTEGDTCNGAGTCSGSAKVCTPPKATCVGNASRSYSGGTCNTSTGACSFSQSDTACPNGCDPATGLCKNDPCAGVLCNTPPSQCHQGTGTCSGGQCSYTLKPENAACDDKDPCTITDRCTAAGVCQGSTLLCNQPPEPSCTDAQTSLTYAPVGACQNGTCAYNQAPTSCAFGCDASTGLCDGDPCTDVVCNSPPSPCHAPAGSCTNGQCSYGLKQAGAACDDGDICTGADACNAAGACKGTPKLCNQPPAPTCEGASSISHGAQGACGADGSCSYTKQTTPCALGCDTNTGLCNGDPCVGVVCDAPPSACHAPTGTCQGGQCSYALLQTGAACNDGNSCTTGDACDATGVCVGTPKVCNSPPEPECTDAKTSQSANPAGTCSAADGSCGYDLISTPCAAGCDLTTGLCKNDPCAGILCNTPPGQCYMTIGTCSGGQCSYTKAPGGSFCDDGDPCTEQDQCDGSGTCTGTPSASCGGGGASGSSGQSGAGQGGAAGKSQGGSGGSGQGATAGQGGAGGAGAKGGAAGQGGAGAGGSAATDLPLANAPGCGCAVPGQPRAEGGLALAALALGVAARARRGRGQTRR